MTAASQAEKRNGRRKSILDLAPLELDCMNMLWPMGEGTVREIRDRLAPVRPRAYTTIMTIMDRLARKGVVLRHKVGRAYVYTPNLSAQEARTRAVHQLVDNFFGGSAEALVEQLTGSPAEPAKPSMPHVLEDRGTTRQARPASLNRQTTAAREELAPAHVIDETLL